MEEARKRRTGYARDEGTAAASLPSSSSVVESLPNEAAGAAAATTPRREPTPGKTDPEVGRQAPTPGADKAQSQAVEKAAIDLRASTTRGARVVGDVITFHRREYSTAN